MLILSQIPEQMKKDGLFPIAERVTRIKKDCDIIIKAMKDIRIDSFCLRKYTMCEPPANYQKTLLNIQNHTIVAGNVFTLREMKHHFINPNDVEEAIQEYIARVYSDLCEIYDLSIREIVWTLDFLLSHPNASIDREIEDLQIYLMTMRHDSFWKFQFGLHENYEKDFMEQLPKKIRQKFSDLMESDYYGIHGLPDEYDNASDYWSPFMDPRMLEEDKCVDEFTLYIEQLEPILKNILKHSCVICNGCGGRYDTKTILKHLSHPLVKCKMHFSPLEILEIENNSAKLRDAEEDLYDESLLPMGSVNPPRFPDLNSESKIPYFIDYGLIDAFRVFFRQFGTLYNYWAIVMGYEDNFGIHATELFTPNYEFPHGIVFDPPVERFDIEKYLKMSKTYKKFQENAKVIGWLHHHGEGGVIPATKDVVFQFKMEMIYKNAFVMIVNDSNVESLTHHFGKDLVQGRHFEMYKLGQNIRSKLEAWRDQDPKRRNPLEYVVRSQDFEGFTRCTNIYKSERGPNFFEKTLFTLTHSCVSLISYEHYEHIGGAGRLLYDRKYFAKPVITPPTCVKCNGCGQLFESITILRHLTHKEVKCRLVYSWRELDKFEDQAKMCKAEMERNYKKEQANLPIAQIQHPQEYQKKSLKKFDDKIRIEFLKTGYNKGEKELKASIKYFNAIFEPGVILMTLREKVEWKYEQDCVYLHHEIEELGSFKSQFENPSDIEEDLFMAQDDILLEKKETFEHLMAEIGSTSVNLCDLVEIESYVKQRLQISDKIMNLTLSALEKNIKSKLEPFRGNMIQGTYVK